MRTTGLMIAGAIVTMVGCSTPASPPASSAAPAPETPVPAAAPAENVTPSAPTAGTATPAAEAAAAPPAPAFKEITVPAGTSLAIELKSPLSSATAAVEDPVEGVLRRALVVDGAEIVPAGAMVSGVITGADRSGRVKGLARISWRFTTLTVGDEAVAMTTAAISRQAQATKGRDAAKVGIGAGAGAVVGAIAGGRKGAVVGGAVGAGAGTGVVLATRGQEVVVGAGASVTTTLTAPLVLRIPVE